MAASHGVVRHTPEMQDGRPAWHTALHARRTATQHSSSATLSLFYPPADTCFIASGVVDLLAHFCGAPAGTELVSGAAEPLFCDANFHTSGSQLMPLCLFCDAPTQAKS